MTDVEKRQDRSPVPHGLDVRARAGVDRRRPACRTATACSSAASGSTAKEHFTTISPRDEAPLAEVAQASEADVHKRRRRRRARRSARWSKLPGCERAKYLFRIARILAERSREFAVLESLNGGKPIKESRDVDLPLAAAHFFYYAGWADKLEYAFPNRTPKPLGVAGPDHPVELPAADARVEDRARARGRATRSCSSRPRRRR